MKEKLLLLGDEAIALGALHAGISGVYAYPGTPSTEITEYIQTSQEARRRGVFSDWCVNEKTAMEAAMGMSYVGKRALVCMKHVGMNVAADAFINSAMTGVGGGVVVVAADDPSMHSSQNEQDSRFYGKFAFVPILEPSSQQEAYDMVRYGFELSESSKLPVLLRVTTRMAHSRAEIETIETPTPENALSYPDDPVRFILLPVNARRRYGEVLEEQKALETAAERSHYNIYRSGSRYGVVACGIAWNYLNENFGGSDGSGGGECPHSVLKISQYPLPVELVRRLFEECDRVLVLEDGQPFVEEQLRGVLDLGDDKNGGGEGGGYGRGGGKICGRLTGEVPRMGELTPDNVREALELAFGDKFGGAAGENVATDAEKAFEASSQAFPASQNVALRPPALCAGCGHRDVYAALGEVVREYPNAKVFSDIGCYTLGALPPFRAIDSCLDMGASITMAKGAADGGQHPSVAVIGDSTFTHSGITGLLDAVNSHSNVTIIISDNLTTGMTGGQDSAGTGRLEGICRGVGVEEGHLHVVVPLPKNIEAIKELIHSEMEYRGVSVIIPRRECIQTLKRKAKQ